MTASKDADQPAAWQGSTLSADEVAMTEGKREGGIDVF